MKIPQSQPEQRLRNHLTGGHSAATQTYISSNGKILDQQTGSAVDINWDSAGASLIQYFSSVLRRTQLVTQQEKVMPGITSLHFRCTLVASTLLPLLLYYISPLSDSTAVFPWLMAQLHPIFLLLQSISFNLQSPLLAFFPLSQSSLDFLKCFESLCLVLHLSFQSLSLIYKWHVARFCLANWQFPDPILSWGQAVINTYCITQNWSHLHKEA